VDALSVTAANAADTANAAAAASALTAAQSAQTAADGKVATSALGVTVATLTSGKLSPSQIPSITTNETYVVATQAAMLALTCEAGDVCVRTDVSKSFILKLSPPATLANWQELLSPASPVQSVAGRTGPITLTTADVGGLATVASTGAYAALTGAPRIPKVWTTAPDNTAALGDEYHAGGYIYSAITNSAATGLDWIQIV
jgi:glucose/arabinose dehydrogenase